MMWMELGMRLMAVVGVCLISGNFGHNKWLSVFDTGRFYGYASNGTYVFTLKRPTPIQI